MIIQWNYSDYALGYLPSFRRNAVSLFFPGGNVGFRMSAFEKVGAYDPKLSHCEDIDMGIRFGHVGKLFSMPSARVLHSSNFSLRKIFDQWFNHAKYQVHLLKKHSDGGIEVFVNADRVAIEGYKYRCVFAKESKHIAIVFVTPFLLMNLAAGATLLTAPLGPLAWIPGVASTAYFAKKYFSQDFENESVDIGRRCRFAALRMGINYVLLTVSFATGLREKMLFVSFSR